jgi:hypothetical protein
VNVESLARFDAGSSVTVETLREAGLVKASRMPVKILGNGDLGVKLTVEAHRFSASARPKIEAAGGSVVELTPRKEKVEREAKPARGSAGASAGTAVAEAPAETSAPAAAAADEVEKEDEETEA